MSDTLPRPLWHLRGLSQAYPRFGEGVDRFRAGKGSADLGDWPDWCFLPLAAWIAIATDGKPGTPSILDTIGATYLAAIGAWRYSKGIYYFDDEVRSALIQTDIAGDLPADVLLRLPEWSVYVATLGLTWGDHDLLGFWAHLEYDAGNGDRELRLLLDLDWDRGLPAVAIHLDAGTLIEAIARTFAQGVAQTGLVGGLPDPVLRAAEVTAERVAPLVSLLLYLCSDEPEIDDDRQPGVSPIRPEATKTKRGWRLFAPDRERYWVVGKPLGEVIRRGRAEASAAGHRTVRPHIRRGHWHGYWLGPRDGERRFAYHWLPPMVIAAGEET